MYTLKKIKEKALADRKPGTCRSRTVRTKENTKKVEQLICSQEENPGRSISPREIEGMTGLKRSSVRRMMKHLNRTSN